MRYGAHEYVAIWTTEYKNSDDEHFWKTYTCGPKHKFPIEGTYYIYLFDVTNID